MTSISWTDATWNPIVGCSIVSKGCTNCYAMLMAARLEAMAEAGQPGLVHYAGTTERAKTGAVWTGKIGIAPHSTLIQPMRWKKSRMIFVNSMSDLFHPDVTDAQRDRIFAVIALTPHHTYQILTKRPEIAREYLKGRWQIRILDIMRDLGKIPNDTGVLLHTVNGGKLPNVWLGVSIEDQATANQRIPILLDTPAAIRWVSAEPLLGPVNLREIDIDGHFTIDALAPASSQECWDSDWEPESHGTTFEEAQEGFREQFGHWPPNNARGPKLDQVVTGGESGRSRKRIRPTHHTWSTSLRDQCADTSTAFFYKQAGSWRHDHDLPDGGERFTWTGGHGSDLLDGVKHHNWPAARAA